MNRQHAAQAAVAALAASEALAWHLRRQAWASARDAAYRAALAAGRSLLVLERGVGTLASPSGQTPMDLSRLSTLADGSAVVCAAYTLEIAHDPQGLWQEFLRIASTPERIFTVSRQAWSAMSAVTPGTRWIVSRAGMSAPTFTPVGPVRVALWAAGAATATVVAVLPAPEGDAEDEHEDDDAAALPVAFAEAEADDAPDHAAGDPEPEADPADPEPQPASPGPSEGG